MNFCKYLRSKEMHVAERPEDILERDDNEHGASCHFWCNQTLTNVGPDDRPVHKTVCNPGRACFED